jgi:hypothetical protein
LYIQCRLDCQHEYENNASVSPWKIYACILQKSML